MNDDFLASVQQEGNSLEDILEPNLDKQEKVTPAESPAGNNQTETAPSSQGATEPKAEEPSKPEPQNTEDANNLPFNKHPAWQRIMEQNRQLEERLKAIETAKDAGSKPSTESKPQVPKEFAELFGDDVEAWDKFQKLDQLRRSAWEQEQVRIKEETERKQKEDAERWQNWVDTSIAKIEETHKVKLPEKSSERNEFMDFMKKRLPSDENGNIDFLKGWEWFQEIKQIQEKKAEEKSNARKELAAATTSGKKSESKEKVLTPQDLRGKSWHSFIN